MNLNTMNKNEELTQLQSSSSDLYYMNLAIEQAKKAQFISKPNPAVGCVLVKDDIIIGQGFTSAVGGNHAEINALQNAKKNNQNVQGSTAYVTLEPCSHYGRTPPCAKAIIENGITRVVVAGLDPNPKVAGNGITMLKEAGINVVTGILTEQAELVNKGFLKAMRTGMPYVRLKIATSLDGRTAMVDGTSKWITGPEAREDVQIIRAISGAIITGSQTVIDDNPSLNVRSNMLGAEFKQIVQPKVVILDRRERLNKQSEYKVCSQDTTLFWNSNNLNDLLKVLVTEHKCYDVMVEAGASIAGAFIEQDLIDELIIYQAPCLLGNTAKPMSNFELSKLSTQKRFQLVSHETIGTDLKLVFVK